MFISLKGNRYPLSLLLCYIYILFIYFDLKQAQILIFIPLLSTFYILYIKCVIKALFKEPFNIRLINNLKNIV